MTEKMKHPIGYDDIYVECNYGNTELCATCYLDTLYKKALDDIEYLRAVNRGLKDELAISNDIRHKQHLKIVELGVPNGAY
jgi:hypothetical protein